MALLADLRDAAPSLDAQFLPSSNETSSILGALVAYVENGQSFLEAAAEGTDAVTELVAEEPEPPADEEPVEEEPPAKAKDKADKPKQEGK